MVFDDTRRMSSEDALLVREVAAEMFSRHGRAAIQIAIEHEENAREKGHHDDADAWLDIASAIAQMVSGNRGNPSHAPSPSDRDL